MHTHNVGEAARLEGDVVHPSDAVYDHKLEVRCLVQLGLQTVSVLVGDEDGVVNDGHVDVDHLAHWPPLEMRSVDLNAHGALQLRRKWEHCAVEVLDGYSVAVDFCEVHGEMEYNGGIEVQNAAVGDIFGDEGDGVQQRLPRPR